VIGTSKAGLVLHLEKNLASEKSRASTASSWRSIQKKKTGKPSCCRRHSVSVDPFNPVARPVFLPGEHFSAVEPVSGGAMASVAF